MPAEYSDDVASPMHTKMPGDPDEKGTETPDGEKELVGKLTQQFDADARREAPLMADFAKWRDYLRGKGSGTDFVVNVNLCQSTMAVLVPRLYAKNPEVSVRPSDAVDPSKFSHVRGFGRTCEIMVTREWRRSKLKSRLKRQVRGAKTVGFAWLKGAMQFDMHRDVVMESRINDLQDNLAEIDRKIEELKEGCMSIAQEELMREELLIEMGAARAKLEVERARGMNFLNPRAEDIIVSGEIRELIDYLQAERITHRSWWKVEQVSATYGVDEEKMKGATRYKLEGESSAPANTRQDACGEWVAVLERWDRKAGVVHTFVHGCDFLLRPSEAPNPSSQRFYPFFLLAWNWVDDTRLPLSDVAQWAPLQDEYNRARSTLAQHRKRSLPGVIANGQLVNKADAQKIINGETSEYLLLEGVSPDVPLSNLFAPKPIAPVDANLYNLQPILYDLDVVSGVQEAARQAIRVAKTATEASIQENAGTSRTVEAVDAIEDMMGEIATYTLELLLQTYTVQDAIRIAGPGAVWPEDLKIDELHNLVDIDIRAGSTGKPATAQEQQVWGTILPIIQPMIERIHQLRQQATGGLVQTPAGPVQMPPDASAASLADALEELLRETVARTDDRLDISRFLPPDPRRASEMNAGMPGQMPVAMPNTPPVMNPAIPAAAMAAPAPATMPA